LPPARAGHSYGAKKNLPRDGAWSVCRSARRARSSLFPEFAVATVDPLPPAVALPW